ncbi:MAG: hypothetical protein PVH19_13715 [Planctomycetia bacterium]|jgi:hypothetical protein
MKRLFQLHQRTRRRLGLSVFGLFCLLPTLVMLAWGVSRWLPSEEAAMEERLSELFGLRVTVDAVEHPEPGRVRLQGLAFYRPELKADEKAETSQAAATPSHPVARLESLEIRRRKLPDPYDKLRETTCLTGTNLEVRRDEISEVVRLFREAIDYRLNDSRANVQLALDRVGFFDDPQPSASETELLEQELSDIRFRLLALEDGPLALLHFCLVDTEHDTTSQPIRLRVGQKLEGKPADRQKVSLWFDLDTQKEQVPCRLLGRFVPLFDSFGPDAKFSGYFCAQPSPDGWVGSVAQLKTAQAPGMAAMLTDVDLDAMVGRRFSQIFTGRANITIDHASFRSGRIENLYGHIESTKPGTIGKPLLMAAAREMEMQVNPVYTTDMATVFAFDEFKARFLVDQRGVFIEGGYQGNLGERAILLGPNTGPNRPVLLWESGRMVKIAALLRTLAPGADAHIPAVRSVEHLAKRLPMK